ncbi:WD-repeat protein, putative [Ixodes scapularis]|uniref:WD-repeat protein, putative n=1 Tax=Ixodes scapularis TaxID=6945 RepID=B7PYV2_IXOSC|nr:WD-repeat protein, putative [Ixodes scapularis]|eukprot:XP_002403978.1 WD-repeat protein, putative [Ixodes scapularis]
MLNHGDEMSLQERVSDLEKKILEQTDEITCLRSTIADLARRMNQLEGRAPVITNSNSHGTTPTKAGLPSLPQHPQPQQRHSLHRQTSNSSSSSHVDGVPPHNGHHHQPPSPHSAPSRRLSYFPTASTTSLHSEGGQSSTSASPVPSPAPSSYRSSPSPRQTPSPNRHISASTSNLAAMKRWSSCSSQDFTAANSDQLHDYSLTKVNSAPHQRLKLEWVYGYRGRDCRANLFLLPTGEMVYFIAAVVVLYNVEDQIQRHYLGHSDDIKWYPPLALSFLPTRQKT